MGKVSAVALYAVTVVLNSDCAKRVCCYSSGFTFIHTAAISCDGKAMLELLTLSK